MSFVSNADDAPVETAGKDEESKDVFV